MENAALRAHRFNSTTNRPKPHTQKGPYLLPLLKKFLKKQINFQDPETQKIIKGRVKDAVIWRLILNATEGETVAIKEILERVDGKVAQKVVGEGFQQHQTFFTNIFQKAGLNGFPNRTEAEVNPGVSEGTGEPR